MRRPRTYSEDIWCLEEMRGEPRREVSIRERVGGRYIACFYCGATIKYERERDGQLGWGWWERREEAGHGLVGNLHRIFLINIFRQMRNSAARSKPMNTNLMPLDAMYRLVNANFIPVAAMSQTS